MTSTVSLLAATVDGGLLDALLDGDACGQSDAELAALLARSRPAPPNRPLCRNCFRWPVNRPRGLCWSCYYTAGVREKYPSTSKFARSAVGDFDGQTVTAAQPTTALPGSQEKVAVLEERARLGLSLWHPDDAPMDAESRMLGLS
jgi:hypothetical protein